MEAPQENSVTGLLGIEPRYEAPEAPMISATPQTFIVKKLCSVN